MPADIGEKGAKQAALDYFTRLNADWPKALVQSVQRQGPNYIVTIMPENKMGILLFMVSYKIWVNATTGAVEKMK
jgi:hypothetical protein